MKKNTVFFRFKVCFSQMEIHYPWTWTSAYLIQYVVESSTTMRQLTINQALTPEKKLHFLLFLSLFLTINNSMKA